MVNIETIIILIISYSMIVLGESARLHGESFNIFMITYIIAIGLISYIVKGDKK